jgi:hypothetical protein
VTARALVQRPGRKIHLATLTPGDAAWLTVCDRDVPVFGVTEHGRDWAAWLTAASSPTVPVCARCRTPLRLAALALAEVEDVRASILDAEALETEVRTLRAEVSRWTTAALGEIRHAVHVRGFRR